MDNGIKNFPISWLLSFPNQKTNIFSKFMFTTIMLLEVLKIVQ